MNCFSIKKIDSFTKNIFIVFAGTSLVNFLNLLYQLLIAHRLSAPDFAAFNSILSVFLLASSPLANLQAAIAKYTSEFKIQGQIGKARFLLSFVFRKAFLLGIAAVLFLPFSFYLMRALKVPSLSTAYIFIFLIASSFIAPVFTGGIQGLELFGWLAFISVLSGALKLALAFLLISWGLNINGSLLALLISILAGLIISYFPLRRYIRLKIKNEDFDYKGFFTYLIPVAVSYFCFINLVSFDMVLVRYFFTSDESGLYSLAQMAGKIFLFLPGAISIVMFPKTSGLNAKGLDTLKTLKRSLVYVFILCALAAVFFNLFPVFVLRVLTGKSYAESVMLGRLFSVSMSFFALGFIFISYFLSIGDLRFIKYLAALFLFQNLAIIFFHPTLASVQVILCLNSILFFLICLILSREQGLSPTQLNRSSPKRAIPAL